ncbi:MAG: hypothetical protein DHS20C21_11480 [Gemmatimonadota bacterium]|nr:MAG: hypothetical protein DHS20C21_11480 [Gemmatimonadota bacterium]
MTGRSAQPPDTSVQILRNLLPPAPWVLRPPGDLDVREVAPGVAFRPAAGRNTPASKGRPPKHEACQLSASLALLYADLSPRRLALIVHLRARGPYDRPNGASG